MRKYGFLVSACLLLAAQSMTAQQPPAPPVDSTSSAGSGGLSKALREIDERAMPFLSRWTVCETQVQKIIQQYFKTVGKDPGPDLAKIYIMGEPKRNGRYEIYLIKCGSAVAVKKELEDNMLGSVRDLLSQPVGDEGEEKYCHDFTMQSAVGGKQGSEIQQKVGIGENNYRMPTGGRQYFSLSLFEQYLRVGATNWWLQNVIGNDAAGYPFWHAGEGKIMIRRPLIDNYDNNTRRVVPNILKFHLGYAYRLADNVSNPESRALAGLFPARRLNLTSEGRLVAGMEAFLPLDPDQLTKTSVFGVNVNAEIPLSGISERGTIDPASYAKVSFSEDRSRPKVVSGPHEALGNEPRLYTKEDEVVPLLRTTGQVSFFYTWWLEVEGSENPPDNIFRADIGINYTEVREAAIVGAGGVLTSGPDVGRAGGPYYLAHRNVNGLRSYRPESLLDWVYAKFEYRNETTFPFGASIQYSNQILMADLYFPLFGNWLYLEAKVAQTLRTPRLYEPSSGTYFMISPVFRVLIPR